MDRLNTACYSLIASAFVLAGLLVATAIDRVTPAAQAGMVVNKETLTMLTAKTRPDEEAMFVLDGLNQVLLIYRLDVAKKQLELSAAAYLPDLFQEGGDGQPKPR